MQLVILMIWSRLGMILSAFFPSTQTDLQLLVEFLAIGSLIGSVFAAITFATAAFSLPMMADRDGESLRA